MRLRPRVNCLRCIYLKLLLSISIIYFYLYVTVGCVSQPSKLSQFVKQNPSSSYVVGKLAIGQWETDYLDIGLTLHDKATDKLIDISSKGIDNSGLFVLPIKPSEYRFVGLYIFSDYWGGGKRYIRLREGVDLNFIVKPAELIYLGDFLLSSKVVARYDPRENIAQRLRLDTMQAKHKIETTPSIREKLEDINANPAYEQVSWVDHQISIGYPKNKIDRTIGFLVKKYPALSEMHTNNSASKFWDVSMSNYSLYFSQKCNKSAGCNEPRKSNVLNSGNISVSEEIKYCNEMPVDLNSNDDNNQLSKRSLKEVSEILNEYKNSFYTVYHKYLIDSPKLEGKIVFKLEIESNGDVSAACVSADTTDNYDLVLDIYSQVKKIKFSRGNYDKTVLEHQLYFLPN